MDNITLSPFSGINNSLNEANNTFIETQSNSNTVEKNIISWDDATWILTCAFIIFTLQSGGLIIFTLQSGGLIMLLYSQVG